MIKELDRVVLADRIDEADLEIGDIGTVVFVYKQQKGYEVEFMTLTGETQLPLFLYCHHKSGAYAIPKLLMLG